MVTTFNPLDVATSALEDENVLDERAVGESSVDDRLGRDRLSSTLALVGGDDDAGLGVNDTVTERIGGESGKDDRVDGSETGASEERDRGFRHHRQVDRDRLSGANVKSAI